VFCSVRTMLAWLEPKRPLHVPLPYGHAHAIEISRRTKGLSAGVW
jgi:hypothetical protein